MSNPFFEQPILNSPDEYPSRHWELDETGQPTQKIIERRRPAQFITAIPKHKGSTAEQPALVFGEGKDLSTAKQQYEDTAIINSVRDQVDRWRRIPDPNNCPPCAYSKHSRKRRVPLGNGCSIAPAKA